MQCNPLQMKSRHRWYDEYGTLRERLFIVNTLYNLAALKYIGGHIDPPANDN